MRASASSTASNLPIVSLNCWRMRAYAPAARQASLPAPTDSAGRGTEAAAARPPHRRAPAGPGAPAPADDPLKRDENIFTPVGAVLERDVERVVTRADFHAGRVRVNERQRDTELFLFTEQMLRVEQPEGEPEHRGHGPKRDVTLLPVEADAEHIFFAFKLAAAPHATA